MIPITVVSKLAFQTLPRTAGSAPARTGSEARTKTRLVSWRTAEGVGWPAPRPPRAPCPTCRTLLNCPARPTPSGGTLGCIPPKSTWDWAVIISSKYCWGGPQGGQMVCYPQFWLCSVFKTLLSCLLTFQTCPITTTRVEWDRVTAATGQLSSPPLSSSHPSDRPCSEQAGSEATSSSKSLEYCQCYHVHFVWH